MKKRYIAGILALASFVAIISGCAKAKAEEDLMKNITPNSVSAELDSKGTEALADFALKLFKQSAGGDESALISPLSVLCALSMTSNGAKGETLAQFEETFGLSVGELNEYLYAYLKALPSGEKYKLSLANAIWMKDDERFTVKPEFLQTNADYYGASVYKAPFDSETLKEINTWVSDHTDAMIKDILNEIPEDAVMYLVNALAFDAEWAKIYSEDQVRFGTFTTEAGEKRDAKMMRSSESLYLDDGNATGFIKYYADGKYAFAALLPNEGMTVGEYLETLTGAGVLDVLSNAKQTTVNAAMPKFECEYDLLMNDALKSMGITDAFDAYLADFSELGSVETGNIAISRVIHKTFIAVDERGTRAGAATAVEMNVTGAPLEPKTVTLDRPFVYMIIDTETNLPAFIGTLMDIA